MLVSLHYPSASQMKISSLESVLLYIEESLFFIFSELSGKVLVLSVLVYKKLQFSLDKAWLRTEVKDPEWCEVGFWKIFNFKSNIFSVNLNFEEPMTPSFWGQCHFGNNSEHFYFLGFLHLRLIIDVQMVFSDNSFEVFLTQCFLDAHLSFLKGLLCNVRNHSFDFCEILYWRWFL